MKFERFLSAVSKARKPSPIRMATALMLRSPLSTISLGGGSPNPCTFPFRKLDVEISNGTNIRIEGKEMDRALQYSQSDGIPELKDWLKRIQKHFHQPPLMNDSNENELDLCVTVGSQDGLTKVFEMLLSPGDNMLLDDPNYPGSLAFLQPLPINLLPVDTDEFGMKSSSLREALSAWKPSDALNPNSDIPKVLYTIPNCGNPTGASASTGRKLEIYKIAQEYDLIIVEDDPYYFLQFNETVAPSYQQLDTDGRVIRSDSMSKVLSSGMRLGWISGAKPFIDRLVLHQQATLLHNSTLIQMLVWKLLEKWKLEGFEKHLKETKTFYESQKNVMIESANKWLTGLAEWNVPQGGMFLWIKLLGIDDTTELIQKRAMEKEIILIPGSAFSVKENVKSSYCRASFSLSSPENIDEGIRRLAELVREELDRKHK
uniref:kynurenine/alpha-aminoadipate aminotransferase, mitochondrial-like n=1 Tax=Styela clava TaxID=7725 RepID=UPI00193AC64A|nr:kynurenine/alpha-aminoadipate aminotransferase, mitochondrial-like [Styela clava]